MERRSRPPRPAPVSDAGGLACSSSSISVVSVADSTAHTASAFSTVHSVSFPWSEERTSLPRTTRLPSLRFPVDTRKVFMTVR